MDSYYIKNGLFWGVMLSIVTAAVIIREKTAENIISCGLAYAVCFYNIKKLFEELKEDIEEGTTDTEKEPIYENYRTESYYHGRYPDSIIIFKDGNIYVYNKNGYLTNVKKSVNAEIDRSMITRYSFPRELRDEGYHLMQIREDIFLVKDKNSLMYKWSPREDGSHRWLIVPDYSSTANTQYDYRQAYNSSGGMGGSGGAAYKVYSSNGIIYTVDGGNASINELINTIDTRINDFNEEKENEDE